MKNVKHIKWRLVKARGLPSCIDAHSIQYNLINLCQNTDYRSKFVKTAFELSFVDELYMGNNQRHSMDVTNTWIVATG